VSFGRLCYITPTLLMPLLVLPVAIFWLFNHQAAEKWLKDGARSVLLDAIAKAKFDDEFNADDAMAFLRQQAVRRLLSDMGLAREFVMLDEAIANRRAAHV